MNLSPVLAVTAAIATNRIRLLAVGALLLGLSGCIIIPIPIPRMVGPATPITGSSFRQPPAGAAGDVVRQVNAFRAKNGLPALSWNDRLASAAADLARDLDTSGTFGHVGSHGSVIQGRLRAAGYSWCAAGENVARSNPTAAGAVNAWIGSPGHRRNMLRTAVNEAGAAVSNVRGRPVWVLELGRHC